MNYLDEVHFKDQATSPSGETAILHKYSQEWILMRRAMSDFALRLRRQFYSLEELISDLANILGIDTEDIDPSDSLIEWGLDSIRTMELANIWQTKGITVKFAELMSKPYLDAWLSILNNAPIAQLPSELPSSGTGPFALTPVQHAYWIGRENHFALGGVSAHFYVEFHIRDLDITRLNIAIAHMVERHPMLCCRFLEDGTQQVIQNWQWKGISVCDYGDVSSQSEEGKYFLQQLRKKWSHRKLAIEEGIVFDFNISRFSEEMIIHFEVDLLVADVLSIRIMLKDLALAYQKQTTLPAIRATFSDYLLWKQKYDRQEYEQARLYWLDRIERIPSQIVLPLQTTPESITTVQFKRRSRWLSHYHVLQLKQMSMQNGITLPILFTTIYGLVLSRWSNMTHFFINVPIFDRQNILPDINQMVADFTNILVLELDLRNVQTLQQACAKQQRIFQEIMGYQSFSGVEILREIVKRNGGEFITSAVFTSGIGMGELIDEDVKVVLGNPDYMISQTPQVLLDHQVVEYNGGLLINWDSVDELFPAGLLDDMFHAFEQLLLHACEQSHWVEPLPDILPSHQQAVRRQVNHTQYTFPTACLHHGFLEHARIQPEAVALQWGDSGRWSYGELLTHVQGIAEALQVNGVSSGACVAVSLPKSPAQVAAVLAVLSLGAAYVPVGVEQPTERRNRIYRNAGLSAILTEQKQVASLQRVNDCPVIAVMDEAGTCLRSEVLLPKVTVNELALAYVIYTSGSTGEPKGVEMTHQAAWNTVVGINARFSVNASDKILALSALDFDLSVYDIFGLLSVGGSLVLPAESERRDPYRWQADIARYGITIWNSVPALLEMLLTVEEGSLATLRLALLSGDWIGLDLAERLRYRSPSSCFIALGGATEAAIWSNWYEVKEASPDWLKVPYGYPLSNQQYRVVDSQGRDCPDWVSGELWIGGTGIGIGYRGDAARTSEQFIISNGVRWYRTGDLGRYWPDGCIEFLGRNDFQIKIRGHRLELGEIESALCRHPWVREAVVLVIGERNKRLAAVLSCQDGIEHSVLQDCIGEYLVKHLASYALPSQYIVVDSFPLTSNGKIDRNALMLLCQQQVVGQAIPPEGELEQRIALIWQELLGIEAVNRDDHFMSLGGNSLLATQFIEILKRNGITGGTLTNFLRHPILKDFTKTLRLLDSTKNASRSYVIDHDSVNRFLDFETTPVQRAYWLGRLPHFDLGGICCHYYMEFIADDIDIHKLQSTLNQLIKRHDALRTIFPSESHQRILAEVPEYIVKETYFNESLESQIENVRNFLSHYVFDPTHWPLFNVQVVRTQHQTRVMLGIDNIIMDALSINVMLNEWSKLYASQPIDKSPAINFRDVLRNRKEDHQQIQAAWQYWSERFDRLSPALLPLAKSPETLTHPQFIRRSRYLKSENWQQLKLLSRYYGVTPSVLLATAFSEILIRWSGQPAVTLCMTTFERPYHHPDIQRLLGDFTSLILLPYTPNAEDNWLQRLQQVQEDLWGALAHNSVSAMDITRELSRRRGETMLMPIVFTSTLGIDITAPFELSFGHYDWGISQTPQVLLDHQVVEYNGGLLINWDSVDELFPAGLLDDMFHAFEQLLLHACEQSHWVEPLPDILPSHQQAVRRQVNHTQYTFPTACLHHGFLEHARIQPEAVALQWGDSGRWSYGELLTHVQGIAEALQVNGVSSGACVAVSLPKSPAQVAAVLAVLSLGAAYVPVGVEQPTERRNRIYRNAGLSAILTEQKQVASLQRVNDCPVIAVMDEAGTCLRSEVLLPKVTVNELALAYVIYTSGSTGEPKGVEMTHQAAWNTVVGINARFSVNASDKILALSALDFDLSVYDIFGLLSVGGSLVLPAESERRDPYRWQADIARYGITIWNSVPALLEMLLTVEEGSLATLRLALLSGDWIGLDLAERLRYRSPSSCFIALGGATEAAIWSNWYEVKEASPDWLKVPYGYPLSNQQYRVVDSQGRDCPDWVSGELWIGGTGIGIGYRGDAARTSEQFIISNGVRWYRTGDLGRYWPDGCIEFLGRNDFQIKIRGHRLELGEIESALCRHPWVREAVVLVIGERNKRLAAVLSCQDGIEHSVLQDCIGEYLVKHLASYALPSQYIVVDSFPLTSNGKIDRNALMLLCQQQVVGQAIPPEGELEQRIALIWQELLGIEAVNRDDHFMSLGGNSLLATQFIEILRRQTNIAIKLEDFLRSPSIASLAENLMRQQQAILDEGII
ncbi:amino acid adenylation domain-containing protein [Xenorhabdus cabanillasii]|uniref:Amino acid adenylation domain-containing protein n=1 Tax=Xenorhabdus cabanillasii TaxID=351673 RepID=A0A3D9UKG2_9GAMM|nr:non-ribosomal peptide synthetase [Xenorhabdus cabanillasii]REF26474.1 amino acid adenylation domain-containing protein [Xenorhabdus cabanillasii]